MDPALSAYAQHLAGKHGVQAMAISLANGTSQTFGARVTADSVFPVGSNTKLFIPVGVGLLVDEGKLSWDDRIVSILPEFRMQNKHTESSIRVRDLFSHVIGSQPLAFYLLPLTLGTSDILDNFAITRFHGEIHQGFDYQNEPFALASVIIHRISGQSLEDFFRSRVFNRLGMSCTSFDPSNNLREQIQGAVSLPGGDVHWFKPYLSGLQSDNPFAASGGLTSTTGDMSKWISYLLRLSRGERLPMDPDLTGDTFAEIITAQTLSTLQTVFVVPKGRSSYPEFSAATYAMAVQRFTLCGIDLCGHEGGLPGAGSCTMWSPGRDFGITVLTNFQRVGGTIGWMIALKAFELHFGLTPIDWNNRFLQHRKSRLDMDPAIYPALILPHDPSLSLQTVCGVYRNPGGVRMHIFPSNTPSDQLPRDILSVVTHFRTADMAGSPRSDVVPLLTACFEEQTLIRSCYNLWAAAGDTYWAEVHWVLPGLNAAEPWKCLPRHVMYGGQESGDTFAFSRCAGSVKLEMAFGWCANLIDGQGCITWTKIE